ncbi:MAG: GAF domain-containing protein [Acidobacteria bacterium]|nr:GAF domain-containing protein [Acidobacteriota bacterium]
MSLRQKSLLALLGVISSVAALGSLDLRNLGLSQQTERDLERVSQERRRLQEAWTELGLVLALAEQVREDPSLHLPAFLPGVQDALDSLAGLRGFGEDLDDQGDLFALRREVITLRQDLEGWAGAPSPDPGRREALDRRIRAIRQLQWGASRFFNDRFHAMSLAAHRRVQRSYVWLFATLCVAILFAAGLGFFLNRSMLGPLENLRIAAERVRAGDTEIGLDTSGDDEFGRVNRAFVEMSRSLREKLEEERRLNRELDRINFHLEEEKQDFGRLVEIARAAASTLELDRVLDILTSRAMEIVGCFRCSVFQIDPADPDHALVLSSTLRVKEGPLRLNLARYPEIRACATRRTAIQIDDVATDEQMREVAAMAGEAGVASLLAVPMLHRDRLQGVLSFLRDGPQEYFTEWDRRLADAIAGIGAVCIANAMLYGAAREARQPVLA